MKRHLVPGFALLLSMPLPALAASVYTTRLEDPAAVYVTPEAFGVRGDGASDDSEALQAALDKAAAAGNGGVVFLPSGRYRLTRTLYVWRGVRVIGYGATRPVFVLADETPGYQKGLGLMVMFTNAPRSGAPPPPGNTRVPFPPPGSVPPRDDIPDASPVTFYPAMSNIDFEIGARNPAAVAIRFHVAQHGYLSHMDFHIGSGLAALTQIGNQVEDLRFYGGRYGILTDNTSPFWPFVLIDSVFEGQREAAIREHMAGLTVIRTTFRNLPIAIDLDPYYSDQLWVKDSRFENLSRAAVVIGNEQNATTQVGFENAVCANVPVFVRFRESGKTQAGPSAIYRVEHFDHGLVVPGVGSVGRIDTLYRAAPLDALPAALPPAIRPLPPTDAWVNVHTLGVKGDGQSDDTEAIQKAIDTQRVLYFPTGYYIVRDTLRLKADTVLIALHPALTQLDLPDSTPAYQGVGPAKALLEAPRGGANTVSGIGLFTGGINPRATAVRWMAGEDSLLQDVRILGGGGAFLPPEVRTAFYSASSSPAPSAAGRWGAQYPSIWVTSGGGGTFSNIWTPNTFAQSGFYASDTKTPGHVYQLSAEHHLFNEIKLDHVENWDFNAPQTEEESATSPEAVAFEINASKNITIANYHAYRVARSHAPAPAAVRVYGSSDIRFRNLRTNGESGYGVCDDNGCGTFLRASRFPYENAIQAVTHRLEVREREFAVLDIPAPAARPKAADASAVVAQSAVVEKLEGGFYAIAGGTVDASGKLYFVDHHQHRIFSWSDTDGLSVVRHDPLDPVNLAVDRSGWLLVQSSGGPTGTVYSFDPRSPAADATILPLQPSAPRAGAAVVLPVNVWDNGEFANQLDLDTYEYTTLAQLFARDVTSPRAQEYVSPDGSLFLPAGRVFRQPANESYPGLDPTGWRWSNSLDAYRFITAVPGQLVYVVSGAENRTYSATVRPDGTLGDLKPFVERGGESVTWDSRGNVYVVNGQIFVYDPAGKPIGQIDVPERPIDVLFGGPDHRTLFILTHHTLYAVKTRVAGAPFAAAPASAPARATLSLGPLFQDHAVLQRDQPLPIWGTAAPGERVTVALGGREVTAAADASGRWSTTLPPAAAGGPYRLEVRGSSGTARTLSDLLIGDVFLCSGQSNMEMSVGQSRGGELEAMRSANDRLRLLSIPHLGKPEPASGLEAPAAWQAADPQTVRPYSAACYFMGREIQAAQNVPVGLIHSSWGGTAIEPWLGPSGLSGGFADPLAQLRLHARDEDAGNQAFGRTWEAWWRQHGDGEPWKPEDAGPWAAIPGLTNWKTWGVPETATLDGMVWFRRSVDLTAAQAAQPATLALGGIDEVDQTWVNGRIVRNTFGWGTRRTYRLPVGTLHAGTNVLVVNVLSTYDAGGLLGPADAMSLTLADGGQVPLGDGWRYRAVPRAVGRPPRAPWETHHGVTTLYNAMIAPLGPYRLRAVAWYQGESNTDTASEYALRLHELMASWRAQFGDPALPFLIVQLPNFGAVPTSPVESDWADLRDAQRRAVAADPHAGLAVAIDIGEAGELHPGNKREVGRRLARAARHVVYGEAVSPSGPVAQSARRGPDGVAVTFADVTGSLVTYGADVAIGFELCGAAPGTCRYVAGRIDGNRVVLPLTAAPSATRVRFGWGPSPVANLSDGSELPAGPFELPIEGPQSSAAPTR